MYLVIAEKPSVSRSIAEVLGAEKKAEGYLEGNGCIVSWCYGHLAEYEMPEAYDPKYEKWNYEDLPIVPKDWKIAISKDKREQFYVLKKLLNRPDIAYVVNACDAGREGELIFKRVYDLSGSTKPVKRLWISSMEYTAIEKGFQQMEDGSRYENLAQAAVCRAKADWLVGMNATRAYTSKYYKKLIIGRVQTPTLAMIVERNQVISNFKKEKYFNVALDCDGLKVEKQKIFDVSEASRIFESCQGSKATVEQVTETEKRIHPPKLYDLTTLQRDANRIYGMTAQQTLNAAQSLYEQKLITYPRTDSQFLTEDMEGTIRTVVNQIHEKYKLLGPFEEPIRPDAGRVMNNKKVSDHHAIIPTAELASCNLLELKEGEKQILFLIAVHVIEATERDHIYNETSVTVKCQNELFQAKGKVVKQMGWKLYEECFRNKEGLAMENPDDVLKDRIPTVSPEQIFYNVFAEKTEHFTSPPKQYSEDTLLAAMETAGNKEFNADTEKKGLGTPATRAGIIEKLVNSQYAVRKGKQIVPTEDGKILIELLPEVLKSASMTAEWENQLFEMEKGEMSPDKFMTGIQNMITMMLNECDTISDEEKQRFQTRESIGTCPICGSLVYEGKSNFYCSNRECQFALWKENRYLEKMQKTIDKRMAAELLKNGRVTVKDLYSAKKNMYFEADLLIDVSGERVNFALEFPKTGNQKKSGKNKRK